MHKLIALVLSTLFAANLAFAAAPAKEAKAAEPAKPAAMPAAASDCEAKALSKAGKPLHGAAKAASIRKCMGGAKPMPMKAAQPAAAATASGCAEKALSKAGKPLAGAARATFMKKCEAEAKAAK